MNVFEFLGLSPTHRKSGKIVQLVKHYDEVPESKIKFPLIAQIKKDGVFGMLVVQGDKACIFGRTGKKLMSCDGFVFPALRDGVYIGEVCLPGKSLEVLSGIVNPNRVKLLSEELSEYWLANREVWFHDHLTLEEFIAGQSDRPYSDRLGTLISAGLPALSGVSVYTLGHLEAFERECVEAGEEGAVFKQDVDYVAGHKGWRAMKRVRSIEYDLLCVGVEEGTGKYAGKVANLIFQWRDGDTLKAMLGKGWTHQDAETMWQSKEHRYNDLNPIGHIFTVYGLQDSSKGKIRLPKVGERRHDKEEPDV